MFATKATKKDFIGRKLKSMIVRSMFSYLTNTELTPDYSAKKIDERLNLLLKSDDPTLILDLRKKWTDRIRL